MFPPAPEDYGSRVPLVAEASDLVSIGPDHLTREAYLTPAAARAWADMRDAALADGIELIPISAFRSIARQEELLAAKLAKGMTLEQALEYSAYPGHSEHHSGNAIDIGTPSARHLEEEFETTPAFYWLTTNARRFGFFMSYPRDNPHGIAYEPWHWCHHPLA
ncbi:MAG: D-alanyl-D-alanine carboxypeptidase family protein [Akkermansiaceae bacterium]|nr:D-alanyl-D-alanine carboxypeptidase family protein [Akkermansiaceae bacterium]MCU0779051.1 D-alanyl-D-alanine carboxypeptidase family protein [Akkermansiaceae bacterium]